MGVFKNEVGNVYSRLTVIDIAGKTPRGVYQWECLCECGNTTIVVGSKLRNGHTRSCGCLMRETTIERSTKHGKCHLPEYSVWSDMKRRCYNKNNKRYKEYREKGIIVGDEFINDFTAWLEHVGTRPTDGRRWSIGRIDNNKGYVRGNMEWQLDSEQAKAHSLQSNNKTGVCGVSEKVFYTASGEKYSIFRAKLKANLVEHTKSFSSLIYGYEEAFKMAVNARKELMDKYGEGFHESHGTKPVGRE